MVRELGHGGMGSVYLARDPDLQRDVAVKLLHRTTAGVTRARAQFREEARALAGIDHPNIVTIYEIGEHEGRQYIAMEYLRGSSLRDLLSQPDTRPSRERILEIVTEVARAVSAAHAKGILHRDIKPENIVVGDDVKVVDFGLARRLGVVTLPPRATLDTASQLGREQRIQMLVEAETQAVAALATIRAGDTNTGDLDATQATQATQAPGTAPGTLFGTPAYMAPEVLQGAPASKASDVYGLGVLLYECLAGHRPYEARALVELLANVIDGEPYDPLDDPLAPLVHRMLSRDPAERPSCDDIVAELLPVALPPPPRRRGHLAVAAIAGMVLAGGGVLWWNTRAPRPGAAKVAVLDLPTHLRSWGVGQPNPVDLGDVVAQLIDASDSLEGVSPLQLDSDPDRPVERIELSQSRAHAGYVVGGRIDENERGHVTAALWIVDVEHRSAIPIVVEGDIDQLAHVLAESARAVAIALDRTPPPSRDPARARLFLQRGKDTLDNWHGARPYLEQAVEDDPNSLEAWSLVATIRGWTVAPLAATRAAIDTVVRLETDPEKRQIWIGEAHFYRYEFRQAREILRRAVTRDGLTRTEWTNARYHLAEAMWHDGDHAGAMPMFEELVDQGTFRPARIHAYQYALVHRDYVTYSRMSGATRPVGELEFARGKYDLLIEREIHPYDFYATIVEGHRLAPDVVAKLDSFRRTMYVIGTRDPADATRAVAALLVEVGHRAPNRIALSLHHVADAAIAAELPEATRMLLDLMSTNEEFHAHRLEILAAPILGRPRTFARDPLTTRERTLATAIEAELSGDRATAARLLSKLVADPSDSYDYPERAALARNLIALGRSDELAALCQDLEHPPVFAFAWLPLAHTCDRAVRGLHDRTKPERAARTPHR